MCVKHLASSLFWTNFFSNYNLLMEQNKKSPPTNCWKTKNTNTWWQLFGICICLQFSQCNHVSGLTRPFWCSNSVRSKCSFLVGACWAFAAAAAAAGVFWSFVARDYYDEMLIVGAFSRLVRSQPDLKCWAHLLSKCVCVCVQGEKVWFLERIFSSRSQRAAARAAANIHSSAAAAAAHDY